MEKGASAVAVEPNEITESSSAGCLAAMKPRAPAMASASGFPRIDCELSMTIVIALARPRFWASKPATGVPFSQTAGRPPPLGV